MLFRSVGQSGGPLQQLARRRSSSAGMMTAVVPSALCVPGGDGWSVVGGAALLRLLRRLKMVVPGSSEHGLGPVDTPQSFGFVDLRRTADSAHKAASLRWCSMDRLRLGVVGVFFLERVCCWDLLLCTNSILCLALF